MPNSTDAYTRHQGSRFTRPDAARWIRPDAVRFLKPGTRVEDVFPALALKYSPSQPRVPAGSGIESGRWTDGSGGSSSSRPMGNIAIDASASEIDLLGIRTESVESDGPRLAANDTPDGLPFNLADEEQNGGHAISEHVGKSERYLKDGVRAGAVATLARGDVFQGLGNGSFTSIESANRLVNSTIARNRSDVARMITEDEPFTVLNSRFVSPTGYEAYLDRANAEPYIRDTYGVRVVIQRDRSSVRGWRIQSAFPLR